MEEELQARIKELEEQRERQPREMRKTIEFAEETLEKLIKYRVPRGHDGPRVAKSSHMQWLRDKCLIDRCCDNLDSMIPKRKALLEDPEKGPFHHETIDEIRILFDYAALLHRDYLAT